MAKKLVMYRDPENRFFRVEVVPSATGIEVLSSSGERLATLAWNDLTFETGGEDNRFIVANGRRVAVYLPNTSLISRVESSAPPYQRQQITSARRHLKKGSAVRMITVLVLMLLAVTAVWFLLSLSGSLFSSLAQLLPASFEKKLGDSAYSSFVSSYSQITDKRVAGTVEMIAKRLTDTAPALPYPIELHILKSKQVNAMAFPGGKIVIFSALLEQAESYDEIAGVLAHEFQHVALRHGLSNISHNLGFVAAFQMLRIMVGLNSSGLDTAIPHILAAGFSRQQESQADYNGLLLAHAAGYSSKGLITFLERLEKEEAQSSLVNFLATHPLSKQRVSDLKELVRTLPARNHYETDLPWQEFQRALN